MFRSCIFRTSKPFHCVQYWLTDVCGRRKVTLRSAVLQLSSSINHSAAKYPVRSDSSNTPRYAVLRFYSSAAPLMISNMWSIPRPHVSDCNRNRIPTLPNPSAVTLCETQDAGDVQYGGPLAVQRATKPAYKCAGISGLALGQGRPCLLRHV